MPITYLGARLMPPDTDTDSDPDPNKNQFMQVFVNHFGSHLIRLSVGLSSS